MTPHPELNSSRLLLRAWRDDDRAPFAAMNRDARVMQYLPTPLRRAESDALVRRIQVHFDAHGFGLWAMEVPGVAAFIGCVGLLRPPFDAHFTPCVEVGWRLHPAHWGHGYATEGAREAVKFGFETMGLPQLVSFTVPANRASIRVMERLGMQRCAEPFDHPQLPPGHRLRRHVLYTLDKERWARPRQPVV